MSTRTRKSCGARGESGTSTSTHQGPVMSSSPILSNVFKSHFDMTQPIVLVIRGPVEELQVNPTMAHDIKVGLFQVYQGHKSGTLNAYK